MKRVSCLTGSGELFLVPAADLQYGVVVYGILIENQRVLLRRNPETGLWQPPGGHLVGRQAPEQGVRSLFRAQTGLVCDPGRRLFLESQHRIDSQGIAWELAVIYYDLKRHPGSMITLPTGDGDQPVWLPLDELEREACHTGYEAIQVAAQQGQGPVAFAAAE
jgi:ADP-ribose pyrophosphatase YjhB (NUDIX family)